MTDARTLGIGMVGAGLAFGFAPAEALSEASPGSAKGFEPTIWYSIDGDGVVTVNVIRAEMGQHIGTALARILSDELEADWAKVRIDAVDTDPKWGVMMTRRQQFGLGNLSDLQPCGRGRADRTD